MASLATRSYLDSEGRWSDNAAGAVMRMEAHLREQTAFMPEVRLYRRSADERWEPVADDNTLSAREQGLVWHTWKAADGALHAFQGVRPVDERCLFLLDGLEVRDARGELLTDPAQAGFLFALTAADARTFLLRLREAGGEIYRREDLGEEIAAHRARAQSALDELQLILQDDRQLLSEVREGNLSGLAGFDRREAPATEAFARLRQQLLEAEAQLAAVRAGAVLAARIAEEQVLGDLRQMLARAGGLLEEREAAAGEIARWAAYRHGSGRHPDDLQAGHPLLFAELARALLAAGHDVQHHEGEVAVEVGQLQVVIGEQGVSLRRPD